MARGIEYAQDDRVGTAVLEEIFHSAGAKLMAAAILLSTFGCVNGMILAGARVYYAMSKDGLFFKAVGKLNPRYKTPVGPIRVDLGRNLNPIPGITATQYFISIGQAF